MSRLMCLLGALLGSIAVFVTVGFVLFIALLVLKAMSIFLVGVCLVVMTGGLFVILTYLLYDLCLYKKAKKK